MRAKISASLKGRKASEQTKLNMAKGSKKKVVYCYDFDTKLNLTEFESLREMSRQFNLSSTIIISRRIAEGKPLERIYKGTKVNWFVTDGKIV